MYVGHYDLELETISVIEFKIKEPETFGEYIKRLRLIKGWSQRRLAQKIETWPTTILNWEKDRYIPRRGTIIRFIRELDADAWEAIKFDDIITDRQRKILSSFEGKPSFTHRDCIELLKVDYLYDDLKYLVNLGVLDEEQKENKIFYRIKKYSKPKSLGILIRKHRLDNGLFARELARLIGVTEDTILNWEKNRTHPAHEQLLLLKEHLKIDPLAIIEFDETISKREKAILELVKERESVTSRECQKVLGLRQRDAQNGLYFLYKLGVLNRELGKRNAARYFIRD